MKKILLTLFCSGIFLFNSMSGDLISSSSHSEINANESEEIVIFTPPSGWYTADSSQLPLHVKAMVIGKGPSSFPPSINLSIEPYKGTLEQYLKIVKRKNSDQKYEWKNLGIIRTEGGNANLSQVDTKTLWGDVRLMHAILVKNGNAYIMTHSALKSEFSQFYKEFFTAMRSLRFVKTIYDMISDPQKREELKIAADQILAEWEIMLAKEQKEEEKVTVDEMKENLFKSKQFQTEWNSFFDRINKKYADLGLEWLSLFQLNLEDQLFTLKP